MPKFLSYAGRARQKAVYVQSHISKLASFLNTMYFTAGIFFFCIFTNSMLIVFTNELQVAHNDSTFENIPGLFKPRPARRSVRT